MANDLTKYLNSDNLPSVDVSSLSDAMLQAADDATSGDSNSKEWLTFSGGTGKYSLGRNKEEVDPDQFYLVEPQSFFRGFICWKNGKRHDAVQWDVVDDIEKGVHQDDLQDHGPYNEKTNEGWKKLLGFGLIALDNLGSQVEFSCNSRSGKNSVADLMREIVARSTAAEPDMPVITFGSTTFSAQGVDNIPKPTLDVQSWVSRAAAAAYFDGDLSEDDLLDGVKPKREKKKKKATRKKK